VHIVGTFVEGIGVDKGFDYIAEDTVEDIEVGKHFGYIVVGEHNKDCFEYWFYEFR